MPMDPKSRPPSQLFVVSGSFFEGYRGRHLRKGTRERRRFEGGGKDVLPLAAVGKVR